MTLPSSKLDEIRARADAAEFTQYRRTQIAEMKPWTPNTEMSRVSISAPDKEADPPKSGDMIARNPANHDDVWLVAEKYFKANFEPIAIAEPSKDQLSADLAECVKVLEYVKGFWAANIDDRIFADIVTDKMPEIDALLNRLQAKTGVA